MSGVQVSGKTVAGLAAFKHHLSYLPHSGSVLAQLQKETRHCRQTKSALHVPWALTGISASVIGTEGRVTFGGVFLRPASISVHQRDGAVRSFEGTCNGFQYEVAEVARCIGAGQLESAVLPLSDSIAALDTDRRGAPAGGRSLSW